MRNLIPFLPIFAMVAIMLAGFTYEHVRAVNVRAQSKSTPNQETE